MTEHEDQEEMMEVSDDEGMEMPAENYFWGKNVKANSTEAEELDLGDELYITSAALHGTKATTLSVKVEDNTFVLCTLNQNCPQYHLDLEFSHVESPIHFIVSGGGDISLTGTKRLNLNEALLGDSDMEDEEEEEEVVKVPEVKAQPPKKDQKKPHVHEQKPKAEESNGHAQTNGQTNGNEGKSKKQKAAEKKATEVVTVPTTTTPAKGNNANAGNKTPKVDQTQQKTATPAANAKRPAVVDASPETQGPAKKAKQTKPKTPAQ